MWKVKCECGNERVIASYSLRSGTSKSCGCTRSWGETVISELLQENNIQYKTEYTFPDLVSDTGRVLPFDFAIFKNNQLSHLIEFDGNQHYDEESDWHTDRVVLHDNLKNQYCKQNHIELKRFRDYENLTIEDLI